MDLSLQGVRRGIRAMLGPAVIDLGYWLVSRRDWAGVQRLGAQLGRYGYRVGSRHRAIALGNIRHAFGDSLPEERVRAIARASFIHLCTLFLEAMRYSGLPREEKLRLCVVDGIEHLQDALAQGRGVVLLTGHLGNWELGALRLLAEDYPLLPLARLPKHPRLADKFRELREKEGIRIISLSEGVRGVLRALTENRVVPVLPDRYAKGRGVDVPYFGHPTHIWPTPALVARRTGCPVLPVCTPRQPDGTFRLEIQPPLALRATDDRDADLVANMALMMAGVEQQVRAHPDQYVWTYELWRQEPSPVSDVEAQDGLALESL